MRYTSTENTWLLGNLTPASTATIVIVNLEDDSLVTLTSGQCIESQWIPGLYVFDFATNATNLAEGYHNYAYQMQDGVGEVFRGKFVYSKDDHLTVGKYLALQK